MKLNELNLSNVLGDYGAAALKQVGNRLTGNAEGNLSVQDKIAKDKFISDFIGRASTNLNSAIQSGLVDPKAKATPQAAMASPNAKAKPTVQQPTTKQVAPAGQPPANQAPVGQPSTTQQPNTPKTPEEIRKEKQAAAGQVAQQQMAANPAPAKGLPPGVNPEKANAAQQAAGLPPIYKKTADGGWEETDMYKGTFVGDTGGATGIAPQATTTQQAPAQQPQQSKMTPQQTAALKGKLKAGATATSGQSGFKNYVGGSGERMTSVDKSGAPVFQKIQRESTYSKLDYILESIINIDEAATAQSISEYLQNMFSQYLKVPITDPKAKQQIKTLADQAQASYPKMNNALTQLANLGFAMSYSQGSGATQGSAAPAQSKTALGSFASGLQKGATGNASSPTATATPATSASIATQGSSPAYDQVMALVSKLSAEEKQKLLATLQEPSTGGAGAFDQMQNQLKQQKSTTNPVDNRQQKLNTNKVKAGNKGTPTPDEQAKFDNLVKQKLAAQP